MSQRILFAVCLVFTFAVTVMILRKLIPFLKSKKMGQHILDIGPRWHRSKEGTPTMGGLSFIIASAAAGLCAFVYLGIRDGFSNHLALLFTLLFAAANGLIVMIDDSAKFRKAQNDIPFVGATLELGVLYYAFALILLTGVVNAVNLTDGIDGLVSSVTLVVGVFFALCAFILPDMCELTVPSALIIASSAGFLIYNFYPARVFMGDTGSLYLGAFTVGCAFMAGNPLIIVVCGIIYIIEAFSVMLQVGYFKITHGKRLFKMAPIHHHFEKCGWSELKIVGVFTFITALFCAIAWLGVK